MFGYSPLNVAVLHRFDIKIDHQRVLFIYLLFKLFLPENIHLRFRKILRWESGMDPFYILGLVIFLSSYLKPSQSVKRVNVPL